MLRWSLRSGGARRPVATPAAGERRLIVNADDLGLSPAVNRGIVELHRAGAVTSASLLMNLPSTADALALTEGLPLDIGVHLTLTVGRPLAGGLPSLVDGSGAFGKAHLARQIARGRLRLAEVEREWSAQIEAFLATGRPLAHLDSHLHIHALPWLRRVALRLAWRYGVGAVRLRAHGLALWPGLPLPVGPLARWRLPVSAPARALPVSTSDHLLVLTAMGPRATIANVRRLLRYLPPGLTELVVHPGYVDAELCRLDPLRGPRERELRLLRSAEWAALLAESGVRLTTFAHEAEHRRAAEKIPAASG